MEKNSDYANMYLTHAIENVVRMQGVKMDSENFDALEGEIDSFLAEDRKETDDPALFWNLFLWTLENKKIIPKDFLLPLRIGSKFRMLK